MIAQHLVTGPVFQALFADYDLVGSNPVSRALSRLVALLEAEGVGIGVHGRLLAEYQIGRNTPNPQCGNRAGNCLVA